ncbi:hypothetical protein L7G72_04510 [Xenorhabdus bovienii]|nr:hypothetical protein [Xenorhabdus bovienii]MCG3461127.1 hypothetical protein [Xenorhabdus bovienii]
MYRMKNHQHIRTTLLLGLVLFTADKGTMDKEQRYINDLIGLSVQKTHN